MQHLTGSPAKSMFCKSATKSRYGAIGCRGYFLFVLLLFFISVILFDGCQQSQTLTTTTTTTTSTSSTSTTLENINEEQPQNGNISIIKLQYKGYGNDNNSPNNEYVIISSTTTKELTSYTLSDSAHHLYTFPLCTIEANGTISIYSGIGTNTSKILYWGRSSAVWNNDTDIATLKDNIGNIVSTLSY